MSKKMYVVICKDHTSDKGEIITITDNKEYAVGKMKKIQAQYTVHSDNTWKDEIFLKHVLLYEYDNEDINDEEFSEILQFNNDFKYIWKVRFKIYYNTNWYYPADEGGCPNYKNAYRGTDFKDNPSCTLTKLSCEKLKIEHHFDSSNDEIEYLIIENITADTEEDAIRIAKEYRDNIIGKEKTYISIESESKLKMKHIRRDYDIAIDKGFPEGYDKDKEEDEEHEDNNLSNINLDDLERILNELENIVSTITELRKEKDCEKDKEES